MKEFYIDKPKTALERARVNAATLRFICFVDEVWTGQLRIRCRDEDYESCRKAFGAAKQRLQTGVQSGSDYMTIEEKEKI